ncbi:suppressor of fused domain protein [Rhodococcus hoagii]|nr:suppressor of fused domain protein [Prescottella equi]
MEASEEVRAAAHRIGEVFGVSPQVLRFRHPSIRTATARSRRRCRSRRRRLPGPGYASYATLDMVRFPTKRHHRRRPSDPHRTDHRRPRDYRLLLRRGLAQCAFQVASGSLHVTPNTIVPNAVHAADPGRSTRHVLLVVPFIWATLEILVDREEDVTTWLQAVPITDSELQFASKYSTDELFERLEAAGADVSDIDRPSVV